MKLKFQLVITLLSIACLFFFVSTPVALGKNGLSKTENSTDIVLLVTPVENGTAVAGVSIRLQKDTLVIQEAQTFKPDGWNAQAQTIPLTLKANAKYTLILTKKDYVKMAITIDTHLPDGILTDKPLRANADIKMLKADKHPELVDSDFPLVLLVFDKDQKKFLPNKAYANSVKMMLQSK
jgi:hypothetical protein